MIKKYVPILRPKQGELHAIRELTPDARKRLTPFFDVHRISIPDTRKKRTMDEHLAKLTENILKEWSDPFFIDLASIDLDVRLRGKVHPVTFLSKTFDVGQAKAIFVTGTDRDVAYNNAIKSGMEEETIKEVCVRVLTDDLDTPEEVHALIKTLGVSIENVHLLVDLKFLQQEDLDEIMDRLASFCEGVRINEWKTFILAGSGFPTDMTGLAPNSTSEMPRTEFELWQMVLKAEPLIGRAPLFGDYALVNPEKPDVDPLLIRAGGKIRYTTEKHWLVLRGHALHKGEKYQQYKTLSQKLLTQESYKGSEYSWGDRYVQVCAKAAKRFGNLTTWVKVDTNHHLTYVGEQVSNYCVS